MYKRKKLLSSDGVYNTEFCSTHYNQLQQNDKTKIITFPRADSTKSLCIYKCTNGLKNRNHKKINNGR